MASGATLASGLQAISGKAKCDVKLVALNYNTVGVKGEKTNASGVLLLPTGACNAAAGLVAYAKGTDVQKPRTLANPAAGAGSGSVPPSAVTFSSSASRLTRPSAMPAAAAR